MDSKATGIVAYISIIGWIIAYFAGDREGAKFHLNQALVLDLSMIVVSFATSILAFIPLLGGLVGGLLGLAMFVLWIMGIVYAAKEEEKELPLIGMIKLLK
jgi:uncharacterized membrane protein